MPRGLATTRPAADITSLQKSQSALAMNESETSGCRCCLKRAASLFDVPQPPSPSHISLG